MGRKCLFKIYNTSVLGTVVVAALVFSCNPGSGSKEISSYKYPYQAFLSQQTQASRLNRCQQSQEKVVSFYFEHEQIEKLRGLEMKMEIGGFLYQRPFNEHIILNDFWYCNDSPLARIGSISIHIADSTKGLVYLWSRKSSYDLADLTTVHLMLLPQDENNDNYKIKINNEWFYK